MVEQYCCMFLIMCKAVLKSLDWQKEFSQILIEMAISSGIKNNTHFSLTYETESGALTTR